MPHEDSVTLGGQSLLVAGPVSGQPASEFEAGFKIGLATYDQREGAFYLVLDDFSGGMGHRILSAREELGTFWDFNEDNAPDTTRPRHITLGRSKTSQSLTAIGAAGGILNAMSRTYERATAAGVTIFGVGGALYKLSGSGVPSRVRATPVAAAQVSSIVHTQSSSTMLAAYVGNRYAKSTDAGDSWADGAANKSLTSMLFWDSKILASLGGQIIFATMSGTTETWNIDVAADAEAIFTLNSSVPIFIGVAQAPWGEPAAYFHDSVDLYVLDFFARKGYIIDTGFRGVQSAVMWNGDIVLTDGWNVLAYSPAGGSIRNIGLPRKIGIPSGLLGDTVAGFTSTAGYISQLSTSPNWLLATFIRRKTSTRWDTTLLAYNGVGWHQIGESMEDFLPHSAFLFRPDYGVLNILLTPSSEIIVPGLDDVDSSAASSAAKVWRFSLPPRSAAPLVGGDSFAASGAYLITGWIDGGFNELQGTALRLTIDAFSLSATSTVTVEYQLDNAADTAAWTQMVDTANAADVFDNATSALYFSQATPKRGIQFRTIRFRITLNRGGTATDSPEIKALTFVYMKVPELRTQWTFGIDVNRMIEVGTLVDGVAATMANVWSKMKSLWDTHTLLAFIIPNVEPSPGINVRITAMPLTFDDFRDAVDGKGSAQITVVEPVE